MSVRLIDRTPPAPSGDVNQDIRALMDYCAYLQEQLNFILTNLNREAGNNG